MKNKLVKILSSNIFFITVCAVIILGLNLTPLILDIRHSPPGRTFAMIHNNVQDFFFYQSLMNEGAGGATAIYDPYTSEPHQSSVIFAYFAWLGKVSSMLKLPFAVTYHATRIILGIALLTAAFRLINYLKIPYPRLTFLLFIFAAPLMHNTIDAGKVTSAPYMNWWTGMDPIRRAAYLPHHMFGSLFLVLSIFLIVKYAKEKNIKLLVYAALFALFLGFIHPPSLFIILLILPASVIIYHFLHSHKFQKDINVTFWYLIYWAVGAFILLFMIAQTGRGFPWSQYLDWEKTLQFPLAGEIVGAMGFLFPFALVGIVISIISKKFNGLLLSAWLIAPFLFIPFAQKLNLSNIRLIQGTPYLPLSMLSAIGMKSIEDLVNRKFKPLPKIKSSIYRKLIDHWIIGIFIVLFTLFTYPTLVWSMQNQIKEYWPIFGNVYLDNRLNNAFTFINKNYPNKTIVLSTFYSGNYLPAFTHTVSFLGHFGYTYNVSQKQDEAFKFFKGKTTDDQAKQFLLSNKIDLVFQGPEEKPLYNHYLYPKILKTVFDEPEATIYTLK